VRFNLGKNPKRSFSKGRGSLKELFSFIYHIAINAIQHFFFFLSFLILFLFGYLGGGGGGGKTSTQI
jgi:hypothetical protein